MSFPMTSGLMHGDKSCASVWEWCRCWARENAVRSLCEFGWMTTLSPTSALWDEKGTQLSGGKIKKNKKKESWVNGLRTPVDVTVGKRLHLHTGWHDDTKPSLSCTAGMTHALHEVGGWCSAVSQSGPAAEEHSPFFCTPLPPPPSRVGQDL